MAASAPGNDANNFTLHRQDSISHCTHHANLCNFQLVVFPVKNTLKENGPRDGNCLCFLFWEKNDVGHFFRFLGMKLKLKPFKLLLAPQVSSPNHLPFARREFSEPRVANMFLGKYQSWVSEYFQQKISMQRAFPPPKTRPIFRCAKDFPNCDASCKYLNQPQFVVCSKRSLQQWSRSGWGSLLS